MNAEEIVSKVSVPLRGKGRDQPTGCSPRFVGTSLQVSVPLRGKGRDQRWQTYPNGLPIKGSFPSPCGEKVGINIMYFKCIHPARMSPVSVPLRGKGRDQRRRLVPLKHPGCFMFPSPCGEKVGINLLTGGFVISMVASGFRPLAGKR